MKKQLIITLAASFAAIIPATAQQHTEITAPGAVSSRTELPRSEVISYNSRDLAFRRDSGSSAYVQHLNGEWKVRKFDNTAGVDIRLTLPSADVSGWQTIKLPETSTGNAAAIYRTEFKMPFGWIDRQIFMHVGPVSRSYYIYINDNMIGYHEDSRSSAEYDITRYLDEGKNYLSIVAYANPASTALENHITASGTSIANEVYVLAEPKVRIRDWMVDTRLTPGGTDGIIDFGAIVKTHLLNTRQVTVHYDLFAPDGTLVYQAKKDASFEMRGEDTVRFIATVPAVETWSSESPALYTAFIRLQHEGRYTEYMTQRIGFRDLRFDDNGIRLNGKPLTIIAADYAPAGDSASMARDFAALREKGVNMVHIENFPQRQLFYDMADIYGIYVCDQANMDSHRSGNSLQIGGSPANDTAWDNAHTERVLNMYHFSRNHPSVIMYSLGRQAGRGHNMYEAYLALKQKEKVRPVVYEGAGAEWNSDIVIGSAGNRNSTADTRQALSFMPFNAASGSKVKTDVTIEPSNDSGTGFYLQNGIPNTSLNNFEIEYIILKNSRSTAQGTVKANIPAGEKGMIDIPVTGVKSGEYTLTINIKEKNGLPWREKGTIITSLSSTIHVP